MLLHSATVCGSCLPSWRASRIRTFARGSADSPSTLPYHPSLDFSRALDRLRGRLSAHPCAGPGASPPPAPARTWWAAPRPDPSPSSSSDLRERRAHCHVRARPSPRTPTGRESFLPSQPETGELPTFSSGGPGASMPLPLRGKGRLRRPPGASAAPRQSFALTPSRRSPWHLPARGAWS